jgi:hypothetical protein
MICPSAPPLPIQMITPISGKIVHHTFICILIFVSGKNVHKKVV